MTFLLVCDRCSALESSCRPVAIVQFLDAHDHGTIFVEAVWADRTSQVLDRYARRPAIVAA